MYSASNVLVSIYIISDTKRNLYIASAKEFHLETVIKVNMCVKKCICSGLYDKKFFTGTMNKNTKFLFLKNKQFSASSICQM